MRKFAALGLLIILILACGAPAQSAIQTAIAQTQAASHPFSTSEGVPSNTQSSSSSQAPYLTTATPSVAALGQLLTRLPRTTLGPTPTAVAGTLSNPIPAGTPTHLWLTASGGRMDFSFVVEGAMRGDPAMQLIRQANRFNQEPPTGTEPILIRVSVRDVTGDGTLSLNSLDFGLVSSGRLTNTFDYSVCCLDQVQMDALDVTLVPGGTATGWIASAVTVGDPSPLLVYDPGMAIRSNISANGVFFALPQGSH